MHESSTFRAWERAWKESETLCVAEGGSPAMLPQGLLRWLDGGSFLPPRDLLGLLEPQIPRLFSDLDPRLTLAESFSNLWNGLHPFAPLQRLHARIGGSWTDLWLQVKTPDDGTRLDLAWLLLPLFRRYPRAFSLPEFETVQAVTDQRPIQTLIEASPEIQFVDDGLLVGGMRLGEPADLHAFLEEEGMPVPTCWMERRRVCVVKADYYCPRRRRVILQAGCAYGAPGFVFRAGFSNLKSTGWNPLSQIIRSVLGNGIGTEQASTGEKNLSIIAFGKPPVGEASELANAVGEPNPSLRAPHRFVYHHADDSISCDGRHMTKRVPARILRKLVMDFVQSGRREFEFRAFKRDSEIVTNRKRPNFEVRLRRVVEVIRDFPCGLILHRRKPGLLELEASAPIEYSEEA